MFYFCFSRFTSSLLQSYFNVSWQLLEKEKGEGQAGRGGEKIWTASWADSIFLMSLACVFFSSSSSISKAAQKAEFKLIASGVQLCPCISSASLYRSLPLPLRSLLFFQSPGYKRRRRNKTGKRFLAEQLQENDCEHLLTDHQLKLNGTFYESSVNHAARLRTF